MSILILRSDATQGGGGGAPAWFSGLTDLAITDIAGGSAYSGSAFQKGARIIDITPTPYTYGGSWGENSIIIPWTGGCSLQARGEYIKAAEGGHASDGSDNGIYALSVKTDVPFWSRIWGPNAPGGGTPISDVSFNTAYAHQSNGAPWTMHGWFTRVCSESNERIWLLVSNQCGSGNWTSDTWSIARSDCGVGVTDASLWMYHGRTWTSIPSSFGNQSGPHAYDAAADQIMVSAEYADDNGVRRIDVPTCVAAGSQVSGAGTQTPGTTLYTGGLSGNPLHDAWSVVTPNTSPRCWIAASHQNEAVWVWNLESPAGWREKSVSGGLVSDTQGCGAYYHAPSRKIVVGGLPALSSSFRTLTVPTDPWNASSGFNWDTVSLTGGPMTSVASFQGTFGGMQGFDDMGDGRACIIMHSRAATQPTYAVRLPATL